MIILTIQPTNLCLLVVTLLVSKKMLKLYLIEHQHSALRHLNKFHVLQLNFRPQASVECFMCLVNLHQKNSAPKNNPTDRPKRRCPPVRGILHHPDDDRLISTSLGLIKVSERWAENRRTKNLKPCKLRRKNNIPSLNTAADAGSNSSAHSG